MSEDEKKIWAQWLGQQYASPEWDTFLAEHCFRKFSPNIRHDETGMILEIMFEDGTKVTLE